MTPRLRLEQRLPLLVSLVLATLLGIGAWLAYGEVRAASVAAARDRMDSVTMQVVQIAASSVQQRARVLAQFAAVPAVAEVAHGARASSDPALGEPMQALRLASDSNVVVALVRRDGSLVFGGPEIPAGVEPPPFDWLAAQPDTRIRLSAFSVAGGVTYYWMAVPITAEPGGGYAAQLRRLTGDVGAIEELLGAGGSIYFASDATGEWSQLGGVPVPAPLELDADSLAHIDFTLAGQRRLGSAQPIAGTTWHIVVERPVSAILAPARNFAWRFALVSALLVVTGVMIAAALSRRLVRPISELAAAARDIAVGAHDRRVGIDRTDEIGQLADAFNTMAGEVERTIADARHSQHAAMQANQAKSAFLATMSHEIRTPINAIIGYIDLLDMGVSGELNATQKQHIDRVREASRHLTGLVEDVLDLAKVEVGELRITPVTCLSDAVAGAAVSVVAPQARLRGVELTAECVTIPFRGDAQRVRQIMVNLLSNAVKFTEPGGSVRLQCMYEPGENGEPGSCVFEVSDTGCGIPADDQAAIFEPFVQLDSGYTRRRGGAGLGLAISNELARVMGGTITVVSQPGRGSTFALRMPAAGTGAVALPAGS